jgi:pyridoxamine 5'-phosphate oxidase family protein
VIDDLVSIEPFVARSLRVYGVADAPIERVGMVGPGLYSRITPTLSWSWNLAGERLGAGPPATSGTGERWYAARRTVHRQRRFDPLAAGHVTLSSCRQAGTGGSGAR